MTSFNFRTLSRLRFLSFASRYFKNIQTRAKKNPCHCCYHQYTFFLYLLLHLFFLIVCQPTCFKNSSYIFSKRGGDWALNRFVCSRQGGYLVSIETEEEWQFINNEIQKHGTWNTSAWHIGLHQIDKVWTWLSGEWLIISKWRNCKPGGNYKKAEISKNGGLFNAISWYDENKYICELPGGKITF